MSSKQERLFEELGLLAEETPQENPYETLGISQVFANQTLREGAEGVALLRDIGGMLYHKLSKRYHPDIPTTGDEERFKAILQAKEQIEKASPAALQRWTKSDASTPAFRTNNNKFMQQKEAVTRAAAELVRSNIELGQHSEHFSQFPLSQGILLTRKAATMLMRASTNGLEIMRGYATIFNKEQAPFRAGSQAFDLQAFLKHYHHFGLQPGTEVSFFIDDQSRASLLHSDLSFIMDISGPVSDHLKRHDRRKHSGRSKQGKKDDDRKSPDVWARSRDNVLISTVVAAEPRMAGTTRIVAFQNAHSDTHHREQVWRLPFELGGSLGDADFLKRARFTKAAGNAALSGAATSQATNHFTVAGVPVRELIELNGGYTPLVSPGNTALLYDPRSHLAIATDAKIVGMIGNGAQE